MQFGCTSDLLDDLARYIIIFRHVGHTAMAAEALDDHSGGLGRMEEVKNGLIEGHTTGHRGRGLIRNLLFGLLGFRKRI